MPPIATVLPGRPARLGLTAYPQDGFPQDAACTAPLHRTVPIYANATKLKAKCDYTVFRPICVLWQHPVLSAVRPSKRTGRIAGGDP
jgi:hypothetical protein